MLSISLIKNLVKTTLCTFVLATILMTSAFANPAIGVSSFFKVVDDGEKQSIAIHIPNTNAPKVTIAIKNENNHVLFQKRAKVNNGFAQKFNIEELSNGQYYLVITDAEKVVKQTFQINDDKVHMNTEEQIVFKHPVVQYNEAKKLMQVVGFSNQSLEVNLYDKNGNIIISETGNQYSKAYNLSTLDIGDYTIEVICEGESFTKSIRL